jgi:large subunit ribosomal protein L21
MYAIIKCGGKQHKVSEGQYLKVDNLNKEVGTKFEITDVLSINDGKDLKVGTPFVDGAKIEAEVLENGKDKKVIIFKKRRRKDSKLKRGFRRQFSKIMINKISA